MGDGEQLTKLFAEFEALLTTVGGLGQAEAAVYALGVKLGTLTTGDVVRGVKGLRQNTAGDVLRRLSKDGYFAATPAEAGAKGGRGHAQRFRVIPPQIVLQTQLNALGRFRDVLNELAEHLETLPPVAGDDEELWRLTPNALLAHFCGSVSAARKTVLIHSNDCSWVAEEQVLRSLVEARKRGVRIRVFAAALTEAHRTAFLKRGISCSGRQPRGQPFAIIDGEALYLPIRLGQLRSEYGAIFTRNPYVVGNFVATSIGRTK